MELFKDTRYELKKLPINKKEKEKKPLKHEKKFKTWNIKLETIKKNRFTMLEKKKASKEKNKKIFRKKKARKLKKKCLTFSL